MTLDTQALERGADRSLYRVSTRATQLAIFRAASAIRWGGSDTGQICAYLRDLVELQAEEVEEFSTDQDLTGLANLREHGCSAGFSGLIYYHETGALYEKHHDAIWSIASRYAEDLGEKSPALLMGQGVGPDHAQDHGVFVNNAVWTTTEIATGAFLDALEELGVRVAL
jgi:hypothetical protein